MAVRKSAEGIKAWCEFGLIRWTHSMAIPSPLDTVLGNTPTSSELVLPESVRSSDSDADGAGFGFPCSPFIGGSMELMAVPRKKVSRHKRGTRNGPKALKPVPVIICCKIVDPCRSSLKPKTVQALICASDWIRNNYKLGHYNGLTVPLADEKGESSKSSMHN